jgi:hypothetical protein
MDGWARAHGDWWTATLAWASGDGPHGVWLRTPAEGEGSTRAFRDLVDLSRRGPARDLLGGSLHLSPASFATADVAGVGKATVATFAPTSAKGSGPPGLGLAWALHDGLLQVAAGPSPAALLASGASPAQHLADDPRAALAIQALHDDATFAVFARPLRFDASRSGADLSREPAVVAWGRRADGPWARVELADAVLRELLHLKAGL